MDSLSPRMDGLPIHQVPLALVLLMVAAVTYRFFFAGESNPSLEHIPLLWKEKGGLQTLKTEFSTKALDMLSEGWSQFKQAPFRVITAEGPRIVLGFEHADELKRLPDTVVDNVEPIKETMSFKYTLLPDPTDTVAVRAIKLDLTQKLNVLNETLADEVDWAIKAELPSSEDWTPVSLYSKIARIVAIASTRIFMGEEMAHNKEWIQTSIDYTMHIVNGSHAIKRWRPWLRPFVYRFVPELQQIQKDIATGRRLLKPIIRARREGSEKEGYEKPDDMLQWMMDARIKKGDRDRDYDHLVAIQLALAFAAIHTTTASVTHMFYDLSVMPQYIDIIRDEIKEQLAAHGGAWSGKMMKSLKKTDSFMKESQRLNPIGFVNFSRRMLVDYTLADGTFLPRGSTVMVNTYLIGQDADVLQGEPNAFDGLRFYKRGIAARGSANGGNSTETAEQAAGKHQFVSISQANMSFGWGRHACPGRFFAGNEIKLILAKVLERYDMRLEGEERYKNWRFEASNTPDPTKNVLLKAVKAA